MAQQTKPITTAASERDGGGMSIMKLVLIAVGVFIGIYAVIFLIGLLSAIFLDGAPAFFSYFRDLLMTSLSISTIVIVVAIGVLIVQIARFVNLLRNEIKPITEDTKQAIKNIRVTTAFAQKNAVAPLIRIQAFFAGLGAFLREMSFLARLIQRRSDEEK